MTVKILMLKFLPSLALTLQSTAAIRHHIHEEDTCQTKFEKYMDHNKNTGFELASQNESMSEELNSLILDFYDLF